jgi:small subunit ribosomal protein S5
VAKPSSFRRSRPAKEIKEFDEEVIQIARVTRVVKGGRRLRFRATVVVGNRKGKVGIGIGKSTEVQGAIQKAIAQAKKTLIEVPMVGQTIPHRIQVKFKSAKLLLLPACPGTGIIAGGPLRKVVELAGIKDILSKSLGCNNRVTNTQAALIALSELKPLTWIVKKTVSVEAPKENRQFEPKFRKPGMNKVLIARQNPHAPPKNPEHEQLKKAPAQQAVQTQQAPQEEKPAIAEKATTTVEDTKSSQ